MTKKSIKFDDLIGKPFEWHGTGSPGYDCWTLTRKVANRIGYELPDIKSIVNRIVRALCIEKSKKDFTKLDKPEPYCLVLFKDLGLAHHIGTVLEDKISFIHILKDKCVVIESLNDIFWSQKIDGFYKFNATPQIGNENGNQSN